MALVVPVFDAVKTIFLGVLSKIFDFFKKKRIDQGKVSTPAD